MYDKTLIIVSHGFGEISGPSIALLYTLRGIAKFFENVYVFNTVSFRKPCYLYQKSLPKNIKIVNYPINIRPYTLGFVMHSFKCKVCSEFYKLVSKLKRHSNLYLLLWSDILNLDALASCLEERKYYVGYNVFFNFAPIDMMLKQKISYMSYEEVSEKGSKIILSQIYKSIDLRLVKYVKHILAHTNYQKTLYNRYLKIPNDKISVIPHMVDVDLIRKLVLAKKRFSKKKKEKLILYAGGKSFEKGVYVTLRAVHKVLTDKKPTCNLKLILVGEIPFSKEFKDLKENIIILKKLSHPQFLKLISLVDAVLVPSQNELFGLVILESLSLGKIVIASNVGGIPEILGHNYELLVQPGDKEDLARVISDLCENKIDISEEHLLQKAKRFDVSAIAQKLYLDLLRHGKLW